MDQLFARSVKAVVAVNRELHAAASDRSCRHIELDLKGRGVQYSTGDHVAVLARNSAALVQQLAQRIGVALEEEFTLHADATVGTLETPFPCPTTVSHALTHYLDINGSVSKSLLRRLSQLAQEEAEKAKLLQLSAKHTGGSVDVYEQEVSSIGIGTDCAAAAAECDGVAGAKGAPEHCGRVEQVPQCARDGGAAV